jgi:hypothetical protein
MSIFSLSCQLMNEATIISHFIHTFTYTRNRLKVNYFVKLRQRQMPDLGKTLLSVPINVYYLKRSSEFQYYFDKIYFQKTKITSRTNMHT